MVVFVIIIAVVLFIVIRKKKKSDENRISSNNRNELDTKKYEVHSYDSKNLTESKNYSYSNSCYSKNSNSNYNSQSDLKNKNGSYGYNKNNSSDNKLYYNKKKKRRENYNALFEDLMNDINDIAHGYGFKNGIEWAANAKHQGEIAYGDFVKYKNCHVMRNRLSHGNARDIFISYKTYSFAKEFEYDIKKSYLRRDYYYDSRTKNTNDYYYKQ